MPSHEYGEVKNEDDSIGRSGSGTSSSETTRPEKVPNFMMPPTSRKRSIRSVLLTLIALMVGAAIIYKAWDLVAVLENKLVASETNVVAAQPEHVCVNPAMRKSWTTLSREEKLEYIRAVRCLAERPSYLKPNSTVYDDFSYIHITMGNAMHMGSGNLPWHRLHIHLYEQALRQECGYNGNQVYWAWEEESTDPVHSNFFDPETGFGGNGNLTGDSLSAEESMTRIDKNRCLVDGPFKDLQPQWYARLPDPKSVDPYVNPVYDPHCITRSFTEAFKDPKKHASQFPPIPFGPSAISKLLAIEDYSEFNLAAEAMHAWLPVSVGGDYMALTAPNDPTFYPHLTNIDRMWWKWQAKMGEKHSMAYDGATYRLSDVNASLDDIIPFPAYIGLERPMRIRDMMDTQSGYLCYTY